MTEPECLIYLVGNKADLSPHQVGDDDIRGMVARVGAVGAFKTSAKTGSGVEGLFDKVYLDFTSRSDETRPSEVVIDPSECGPGSGCGGDTWKHELYEYEYELRSQGDRRWKC
eukprot:gnl/Dysnectes_brevis/6193_a9427_371.p2 GENE.gnl/Dysnectes_brevis/6193_a9427_371~~gnl/Dysnectes_brevis/6193_a9427_371.p2  ORF type:complete len:113 (+),score=20.35 gnl/Dysnectes_brevis/6193_a9427_371:280-618(+)